ncbi:MAG: hypothetical protein WAN69_19580 [Candidatus Korobacteraceae bacterium]|jgi:hypothetical protein
MGVDERASQRITTELEYGRADEPVTKADLQAALDAKGTELLERIEKVETTLLREFRKWAVSFESRFRANEVLIGGFNERLVSLEERVSDIEGRKDA